MHAASGTRARRPGCLILFFIFAILVSDTASLQILQHAAVATATCFRFPHNIRSYNIVGIRKIEPLLVNKTGIAQHQLIKIISFLRARYIILCYINTTARAATSFRPHINIFTLQSLKGDSVARIKSRQITIFYRRHSAAKPPKHFFFLYIYDNS